ncbi:MAG: hypothetical protein GC159_02210 [Phycisphaera sp.]|nr:hypothetical protein [Phycisphaera sp.]
MNEHDPQPETTEPSSESSAESRTKDRILIPRPEPSRVLQVMIGFFLFWPVVFVVGSTYHNRHVDDTKEALIAFGIACGICAVIALLMRIFARWRYMLIGTVMAAILCVCLTFLGVIFFIFTCFSALESAGRH